MKNLQFNRIEKKRRHEYLTDFQKFKHTGDFDYTGYIKCKLAHGISYSIVIPEQIYVKYINQVYWIQPFHFTANYIIYSENFDDNTLTIYVDISFGAQLEIKFKHHDLISKLPDGSFFYNCTIKAPPCLHKYKTGVAKIIDNVPFIKLYHHTSPEIKIKIRASNEFWSSNWNIQGIKKKLSNISYLYLTALPNILCDDDLAIIAMSSHGKLYFRLDQNTSNKPDVILDVYRESTRNRTAALTYWVKSSLLATQPVYKHKGVFPVYYEIVCPFVYRLGVESGTKIKINGDKLIPEFPKKFDYMIVGDTTTEDGLIAPFDEENTKEILKIETLTEQEDIIMFWLKNENSNQYENKNIETAKLKNCE
jgi:hypothetical protein